MSEIETWAKKNGATENEAWAIDAIARSVACDIRKRENAEIKARLNGKEVVIKIQWENKGKE